MRSAAPCLGLIASLLSGVLAASPAAAGDWSTHNVLDHLRGKIGIGARAAGDIEDRFGKYRGELTVNCADNSTTVFITSKRMIVVSASHVAWSIDGGPVQRGTWSACQDNNCVGLWNGTGIPFVKSLFDKSRLKVEITPSTGGSYRGEFPIAGAKDDLLEVGRACGWLPKDQPKKP